MFSDAAINTNSDGVGLGVVVCRPDDMLAGAMEMIDQSSLSPFAAEVQALLQGIRLLKRMQCCDAQIFSDSANAINMILG